MKGLRHLKGVLLVGMEEVAFCFIAGQRSEVLGRGSQRGEVKGNRIAHWLLCWHSLFLTHGCLLSRLAPTLKLPARSWSSSTLKASLPHHLSCNISSPACLPAGPVGTPAPISGRRSSLLLLCSMGRGRRGHTRPLAL